jgi:hypothetical protein
MKNGTWWNAAIHFDQAAVSIDYRKVNLATHERGRLASGDELPTFQIHLANGIHHKHPDLSELLSP